MDLSGDGTDLMLFVVAPGLAPRRNLFGLEIDRQLGVVCESARPPSLAPPVPLTTHLSGHSPLPPQAVSTQLTLGRSTPPPAVPTQHHSP